MRSGLRLGLSWLLLGLCGLKQGLGLGGMGLAEQLLGVRLDLELAGSRSRRRRRGGLLGLLLAELRMKCEDLILGQGLLRPLGFWLASLSGSDSIAFHRSLK